VDLVPSWSLALVAPRRTLLLPEPNLLATLEIASLSSRWQQLGDMWAVSNENDYNCLLNVVVH